MLRAHRALFTLLACSVPLASCAVDEPMVGRPLAVPKADPAAVDEKLAPEPSGPVIEILVPPDAEVAPVEAATAVWVLATAQESAGIAIDQGSLDCMTTGIVQVLGPDRSVQLPDTGLNDGEIPPVGELMSICTADLENPGRLYADAAGLSLSEPTLDCLDVAFTEPAVAKAATTAALWAAERDLSAVPAEVDQIGVDTVVTCLSDDELARLLS
jgi:hypothetical protein